MNILKDIYNHVDTIARNDSLCSFLEKSMKQELVGKSFPHNYFYLKEITNPIAAYHSRKNSDIKKSAKLGRKLSVGSHLHHLAGFWFRNIDGFVTDEAILDGIWVGIPGIRGKIDYRIGESIIEFKTKPKLPKIEDEVFTLFPHDLEQLLFYSIMSPHNPKENYLVFMEDSKPHTMIAFKVVVKDFNFFKNVIKERMKLLNEALTQNNPEKLGRCRYHITNCHFKDANVCKCDDLKHIDIEPIKNAINLEYDSVFTEKVNDARKKSGIFEEFSLSFRDAVIAPRKHYMQNVLGIQIDFEEKYPGYWSCLWQCVNNIKSELNIGLNKREITELYKSKYDVRFRPSAQFIKLKSSTIPDREQVVPYLSKVSSTSTIARTKSPNEYYLTELAINCAMYGIEKGIIFVVYPELNKLVRVFEVNFRKTKEIKKKVVDLIDFIQKSEDTKDLYSLPPCPKFMNDGGKCPLMKECNAVTGKGCA